MNLEYWICTDSQQKCNISKRYQQSKKLQFDRRAFLLATASVLSDPHVAWAQTPPAWAKWDDLLNLRPDARPLNQARQSRQRAVVSMKVQRIEEADGPQANFDNYIVRVVRLPTNHTSIQALFEHVRRNINSFLDNNVATVSGLEDADTQDWGRTSPAALGSVMRFKINLRAFGMSTTIWEEAAVVTSQSTAESWVFSPVTIDNFGPGEHPVSGNRRFGWRQDNNRYELFHRGSDRHVNRWLDRLGARLTTGQSAEELTFKGMDKLWESWQAKVTDYINTNGGSASVIAPERVRQPWDAVKRSNTWRGPR